MEKVFCKNCKNLYFGNTTDQCSFISGIEKFKNEENYSIKKEEIEEFKDKIRFGIAYGNLNKENLKALFVERNYIHIINGKTIGIPSKLNMENSCPFYKEDIPILENIDNEENENIGKFLFETCLKILGVGAIIIVIYLIILAIYS